MSHFFENLDTDFSTKKNTQKIVSKTKQKKDKISELEQEIENMQINHKNIDNLIKEMKQHHKKFAKEGMPEFLRKFLESCMNYGSSKIKSQVAKYLSLYKTEEDVRIEETIDEMQPTKTDDIKETDTSNTDDIALNEEINKIITKNDQKTQEEKLLKMLNKTKKHNQKAKIYLTLLTIYVKKNNYFDKAIETINNLIKIIDEDLIFCDIDIKKIIVNNIDTYIGFLLPFVNEERKDTYEKVLDDVTFLNPEKIQKKRLIYNFFVFENNKNVTESKETYKIGDEIFDLLYYIRNKKYKESIEFYKNSQIYNKNSYKIETKYDNNYNILRIISELGIFAFEQKDYKLSFDLLKKSYMNGIQDNENLLLILCMILEDEVIDEYFYDVFYENLSCIDENSYLMESLSQKEEIYRAYFYLVNFDIEKCSQIMKKIMPYFECRDIFMERIMKNLKQELCIV